MANVTIKNLPRQLHQALKQSALRHHRSLNGEIIHWLENALYGGPAIGPKALMDRIAEFQEKLKGKIWVTESELQKLKRQGRP